MIQNQAALEKLSQADDARVFLREVLASQVFFQRKISVAEFSRRCGFASRSYLTEFLIGKKGLSSEALSKIKRGLGRIPKSAVLLFELLAFRDFPGLMPKKFRGRSRPVGELIQDGRARLRAEGHRVPEQEIPLNFSKPELLFVYAGLGTVEHGATEDEVAKRTGFSAAKVRDLLAQLASCGAARQSGSQYFAIASDLSFLGLSTNSGLTQAVRSITQSVRLNASSIVSDQSNCVQISAVSLDSADVESFHADLRNAIEEVFEKYQVDAGDRVQRLFIVSSRP